MMRTGQLQGEAHPRAKLTEAKVVEARRLYREGQSLHMLAKRMGVTVVVMHSAIIGRNWAHVSGALIQAEMRPRGFQAKA